MDNQYPFVVSFIGSLSPTTGPCVLVATPPKLSDHIPLPWLAKFLLSDPSLVEDAELQCRFAVKLLCLHQIQSTVLAVVVREVDASVPEFSIPTYCFAWVVGERFQPRMTVAFPVLRDLVFWHLGRALRLIREQSDSCADVPASAWSDCWPLHLDIAREVSLIIQGCAFRTRVEAVVASCDSVLLDCFRETLPLKRVRDIVEAVLPQRRCVLRSDSSVTAVAWLTLVALFLDDSRLSFTSLSCARTTDELSCALSLQASTLPALVIASCLAKGMFPVTVIDVDFDLQTPKHVEAPSFCVQPQEWIAHNAARDRPLVPTQLSALSQRPSVLVRDLFVKINRALRQALGISSGNVATSSFASELSYASSVDFVRWEDAVRTAVVPMVAHWRTSVRITALRHTTREFVGCSLLPKCDTFDDDLLCSVVNFNDAQRKIMWNARDVGTKMDQF